MIGWIALTAFVSFTFGMFTASLMAAAARRDDDYRR